MATIAKPTLQFSPTFFPKRNFNSLSLRKSFSFPPAAPSSLANSVMRFCEKRSDRALFSPSISCSEVKWHSISVSVGDESGVINRIARVFATRGYNIESHAVGLSEDKVRFTIVVSQTDGVLSQAIEQLQKLVNVLKVEDLLDVPLVERELMLEKVNPDPKFRAEIMSLVEIFRAKIVDISELSLTIEVTGDPGNMLALQRNLSKFGILEIARTGKRGLAYSVDLVPQLEVADSSIELVTGPRTDVIIILQHPSDLNLMKDAIANLCQNDNIHCQAMKSYTKEKLVMKLCGSRRRIIIATDHGDGDFLAEIASLASCPVIGVPRRASEVTGFLPEYIGMSPSPKLPIMLVGANDAIGAAELALRICNYDHQYPEARNLKGV